MLKKVRISAKLFALIALSIFGIIVMTGFSLSILHQTMIDDRAVKIRNLSEIARDVVVHYYDRSRKGEFDEKTAQHLAKEALRKVRYDKVEYYFIYKTDGTNVLLPTLPEREGKNFYDLQDPNGVYLIRELIKSAQQGGKPAYYVFAKGEKKVLTDKVAAAVLFEPWQWIVGTGIYLDDVDEEFRKTILKLLACFVPILLLVCGGGWYLARNMSAPLKDITSSMNRLASGDKSIVVKYTDHGDEIGDLAGALETFKENAIRVEKLEKDQQAQKARAEEEKRQAVLRMADTFESSVGGVVKQVSSAASQMQSSSESMGATAEEATRQASAVAAASEQASANVQTVAAATEELSSSISEISRQVTRASQIASAAVKEAEQTNVKVQGLAQAANKIGEVVALITDIAEQTNLLALNATIEAARAGDAGKGFAVVASEVKNLANQTAKATDEIGAQIAGIQAATQEAVSAIESITKTISQINEVNSGVASAVEEQGAATQEIARNVEQAAAGTQEVSANIAGVSQAASETGTAAGQILSAADDLSRQSETLRAEVDKFLVSVRAA